MPHYAVEVPGVGRVAACSVCHAAAATRYLPSEKKRRNYCDDHGPHVRELWKRLVRYDAPPPAHGSAVVMSQAPTALADAMREAQRTQPMVFQTPSDDFEARVLAILEKRGVAGAARYDENGVEKLLDALDADSVERAIELVAILHTEALEQRRELERTRTARDEAERRFAEGARLYREVEERLDKFKAAEREHTAEIARLSGDLTTARAHASRLTRERDAAETQRRILETERVDLIGQREIMHDRIDRLTAALEASEAMIDEATRPAPEPSAERSCFDRREFCNDPSCKCIDNWPPEPLTPAEVDRVIAAPSVEDIGRDIERAVVTMASPPCATHYRPPERNDSRPRPMLLSEIVARIVRAERAPTIVVPMKADKLFRDLQSGDRSKVRHALELVLTGKDGARVEHLVHAGSRSPRYTRGRDLYAIRAGKLLAVLVKNPSDGSYTIDDFAPAHTF